MTLALEILGIAVAVLLVAATALRIRKLRRDETREFSRPLERRLVSPPPSPYTPSKGFRLLSESGEPVTRPPVQRPRLDPAQRYVFGDSPHSEESNVLQARHNDDWFLSRSAHRSTASLVARGLVVVLLIIVVVAVVVTYSVDHHRPHVDSKGTTTTTHVDPTTTTAATSVPSSYRPTSASGDDANYTVDAARYRVTVTGAFGESWAQYNMGPSSTLEWQGPVDHGSHESLVMIGNSRVTLGSPSSASVSVDGRPVVFPSPLPATLVLVFTATGSSATS